MDDFTGLGFGLEVLVHVGGEDDGSVESTAEDDDAFELAFQGVVHGHDVVAIDGTEVGDDGIVARGQEQFLRAATGFALLCGLEGLLEFLLLSKQGLDLLLNVMRTLSADFAAEQLDQISISTGGVVGFEPGNGFDTADAGGDGAFADEAEEADLTSVARVGAAAEFHAPAIELVRLAADLHDADEVAILLAEESHDAVVGLGLNVGNFAPGNGIVGDDAFVHESLDVAELLRGERGAVEVEGELVRRDAGALLRGVLADDFMQRPMQNVRDGVVALDGVTTRGIDDEAHGGVHGGCFFAFEEVQPGVADLGGGADREGVCAEDQLTRITDLATHFGVAGGDIEHDGVLVLHRDDFQHAHIGFERVVADELGRSLGFDLADGDNLLVFLASFAGALLLLFHELLEASGVHGKSAFAGHEFGEVEREAVGVVEFEGSCTRKRQLWAAQFG